MNTQDQDRSELEAPQPQVSPTTAAVLTDLDSATRERQLSTDERVAIDRLAEAFENRTDGTLQTAWTPPKIDQVLIARIALSFCVVATVAVLPFYMVFAYDTPIVRRIGALTTVDANVVKDVRALTAAWHPEERERLLGFAADGGGGGARVPTLKRALEGSDAAIRIAAAEYAGSSGAGELRPTLEKIATGDALPELRAKAILAAHKLAPWPPVQVRSFLRDIAEIQLAALQTCAGRSDAPFEEIIELMLESEGALRQAAIETFSTETPAKVAESLWERLRFGAPEHAEVYLAALARTSIDVSHEPRLAESIGEFLPPAQLASLEILGGFETLESAAAPLWILARDSRVPPIVRARAVYCLEQTRSFDADQLVDQFPVLDPLAAHFAARCLIHSRTEFATTALLNLTESQNPEVAALSKQLLAWATGRSAATTRAGFQEALASAGSSLARRALPKPRIGFAIY